MRLTKHHALGNDFLVLDTAQRLTRVAWPVTAQRLCHRRRGIGADGLLLLTAGGDEVDAHMALYNADGSRAEMSGNGIRCLAQAELLRRDLAPPSPGDDPIRLAIATDAGRRSVAVHAGSHRHTVEVAVDMGPVSDSAPPASWAAVGCDPQRPVAHLEVGNPHTVVAVDDVAAVDLAALGAQVPDVNLEIITGGPHHHEIVMRVHERGVGITEACGTGAVAAAHAAVRWGLAGPKDGEVVVHMDGGAARVRLATGTGTTTLIGPATYVAAIEVPG